MLLLILHKCVVILSKCIEMLQYKCICL